MAIMRGRSRLTSGAPPPSPIPTAKGSRSASNENFTQFLDKCLQIPDLAWPPQLHPHFSGTRHPVPAEVDLRSLSSDAIARLLVSARESGAFRITNHGISAEELGSVVREAESVFGNDGNLTRRFIERTGNREEIKWVRESGQKVAEDEKYQVFCKSMEKVASKVEAIADQVSEVLFANAEKQVEKKMRSELGKVRLYRYNHQDHSMEQNPSSNYLQNEIINGNNLRECEDHHALCLHLPLEHSQFNIRSEGEGGSLCFDAGPETLVVTVGNQLEGFKCVSGEMIFVPDIIRSQASFSIQFKVPLLSNSRKKSNTVSITDQIFIAVILCLLYMIFVFVYTYITTT
ncbi:hypothetical protein PRUPE_6G291400 [Prunus persica]|uniref:Non-haem dioxygenase N-terminal domain-containing protein n=1 Tax=Prunus persica TaxID=3760 RepID=A0A251NX91_PRUPE|nr:uncharacterized protein LOC18773305 [Prunus persica]ONI03921.1 hypothetical protein PRUPE_6G291400 [Prunus persica]